MVPITVAQVGEKFYPVDKMDVLAAHREMGSASVRCMIVKADSVAHAQLIHINLSNNLPINPFLVSSAVKYVKEHVGDELISTIKDSEYEKIDGMMLPEEIREKMSTYITSLGSRMDTIPSFLNIFRMISKLDCDSQTTAINMVIKYCDKMAEVYNVYTLPEPSTLENILEQFVRNRMPQPIDADDDKAGEYDSKKHGDADGEYDAPPPKSISDAKARTDDKSSGYCHTPDAHHVDFLCDCGLEYLINTKNKTVRKHKDQGDVIVLHDDYGSPIYPIRNDAAEYLNLFLKPIIRYYTLSDKERGDAVIISRKELSDDTIKKMKDAMNPP